MSLYFKTWFLASCLLASSLIAFSEETDVDDLLDSLIEKSGLSKQIEQYPSIIKTGVEQYHQKNQGLTDDKYESFIKILENAYKTEKLNKSIRNYLHENLSQYIMQTTLEWLNSELGKKVTELEIQGTNPDVMLEIMKKGEALFENEERVEKIKKFEKALHGIDAALDIMINSQVAMFSAISSMDESGKLPPIKTIVERMNSQREKIREQLTKSILQSYLYIFRSLSNEELDQYTIQLEKETSQELNSAIRGALNEALVNASRDFGQKLAEAKKKS